RAAALPAPSVPAPSSPPAGRGGDRGRSAPARAQAYVEPLAARNSAPQHEVAKGSGQGESALAKAIALSNEVAKNPAPSTPGGASAKVILLIISSFSLYLLLLIPI